MSMAVLILLLLAGGVLAWQSERINPNLPRWVALLAIVVSRCIPARQPAAGSGRAGAGPRRARRLDAAT